MQHRIKVFLVKTYGNASDDVFLATSEEQITDYLYSIIIDEWHNGAMDIEVENGEMVTPPIPEGKQNAVDLFFDANSYDVTYEVDYQIITVEI